MSSLIIIKNNQFHRTEFEAKHDALSKRKTGGEEWASTDKKYNNLIAARKVSPLGALDGTLEDLVDAYNRLTRQSFTIGSASYLLITHRFCRERFEGQQWALGLHAWWPTFLEAPWAWNTGGGASFAALTLPEDEKQLEVGWLKSLFNDSFFNMLLKPHGEQFTHLVALCKAWLDKRASSGLVAEQGQNVGVEAIETAMDEIASFFRGLLALLEPEPGICNSAERDVTFVFPSTEEEHRTSFGIKTMRGSKIASGTRDLY